VYRDPQGKVEVDNAAKLSSLDQQDEKLIQFNTYGIPSKSDSQLTDVKEQLSEYGKNSAVQLAKNMTSQKLPSDLIQGKLAATFNPGSLASFAGTIFEASVGALLGDKSFQDYSEQAVTSAFDLDIRGNDAIKKDFKIPKNIEYLEVKGSDSPPLIKSIAKKIYQVTELNRAATSKTKIGAGKGVPQPIYDLNNLTVVEGVDRKTRTFKTQKDLENYLVSNYTKTYHVPALNSPSIDKGLWPTLGPRTKKGAAGYIPNFAQGGPLEDAIQREMAAGLDPSQIRVTKDGRLKNSRNPDGFAVINTRDEPDGKVPNFAKNDAKIRKEILGKGTAQGPLMPKGYQIPQNSGGYVFDYGVGSAQAAPPATVNSAEQDAVNKSILSTNKLLLAFSGLSIATNTLQSTFKNTDSVIAKTLTAVTQVATTTAGYAGIGSLAGETFKGNKGALGKVAGYMGPAGAAIGAGIGIYQALDEMMSAPRIERETQAKKKTESLAATGTDARDKFSILKEDQARIEARRKELESGKVDRSQRQADRLKQSGPYGVGAALPMTEKEKKEELEILALEAERSANQQKLRDIKAEIILSDKIQIRQEEKAAKDLVKRVALTTQLNGLTEAFADGQNKALIERAKREASFIKNAATLNNYQKQEESNRLDLLSIDDKISDSKKSILESTIKELSKASLATGEQEALDILRKKIESGQQNLNIEEELNKLNIKGNSEAGITIKNALTEVKIKENGLKTEKDILRIKQQSQIQEQIRNKNSEIELRAISERVTFEKQLENLKRTGGRAIEDLDLQAGSKSLQNQISKQPFATRAQQSQLERFNAEIRRETELRSINRTAIDAESDSFENLKSKYTEQINLLSFLRDDQKKQIKEQLASAKTAEDLQNIFAKTNSFLPAVNKTKNLGKTGAALNETSLKKEQLYLSELSTAAEILGNANKLSEEQVKQINKEKEKQLKLVQDIMTFELALSNLREKSPARAGAVRAIADIGKETESFSETFSYNTTIGFRDGLRDALSAAVSGTDDLKGALQGVAQGFLKTMQQAFLQNASNNVMQGLAKALPNFFQMPVTKSQGGYIQKFASGGFVTGGSGIRDDVPAMLSSGEYVMRKSAVQKYGAENMAKMNSGGIFLPGVRGGSEISGYDQLSKFANQTTTSGATDVLKGSKSTAFANLEDQSARLSRFGLMNEDTIKGEITSAQQQGLDIMAQREAYRTQQRKAMQKQIISTVAAAALSYGAGKLGSMGANKVSAQGIKSSGVASMSSKLGIYGGAGPMSLGSFTSSVQPKFSPLRNAYGGMIRGFNNGGGPTDDIPALLMGGEYVMDRGTVRKYGKQYLDSMNSGRAKFAEGGYAGAETETTTESNDSKAKVDATTGTAVNISINVSGSSSSTESQGQTSQGGVDYKKMGERIKAVVLETINEEKRLGGALRTR
jgi:hypothetical protein